MSFAGVLSAFGTAIGTYYKYQGEKMQREGAKLSAEASRQAGRARNVLAQFEAAQMEQIAGQSIAASQREAAEHRRAAKLVQSRALAVAAASGGGASDTTIANLMASYEAEGAYRAAVSLYEGEEQARQLRIGARGKRYEGAIAEKLGEIQGEAYMKLASAHGYAGRAGLFEGASSFSRYWR